MSSSESIISSSLNNHLLQYLGISAVSLITGILLGKGFFSYNSNQKIVLKQPRSQKRDFKKGKKQDQQQQKQARQKQEQPKDAGKQQTGGNNGLAGASTETSVTPTSFNDEEFTTDEEYDDEDEEDEEDEEELEIDSSSLNEIPGEVRMVLVIRTDLGMTKGKVAAQCAHAAVGLYRKISSSVSQSFNLALLRRWERYGQAKITLKCSSQEEMDLLYAQAISLNINSTIIHDAGRTQIASGSATVLGIGPAPKLVIDQVTGSLKLY